MAHHVYDWMDIKQNQPKPGVCLQVITGASGTVTRVQLEALAILPTRTYQHEQIAMLLSGRMLFTLGKDVEVELLPGQVIHLSPNTQHRALAVEDSVMIDVLLQHAVSSRQHA